jgi:hypothetical protein
MTPSLAPQSWVWVIVQESESGGNYFGQQDDASGVAFIPAFHQKDDALECLRRVPAGPGLRLEAQAVHYGDLCRDAALNGFLIFMLGPDGRILERISPHPPAGQTPGD